MRCIYFTGEKCEAKPTTHSQFTYTPTKEEKEKYCNNAKFQFCPRYDAFLDYLRAVQK